MTYCEFKFLLESVMTGDKTIPDDNLLIPLVNQLITKLALKAIPLTLVTKDMNKDFLSSIDGEYFLRKPVKIINNISLIDIDDKLHLVLVYDVASFISHNVNNKMYKSFYDEEYNNYIWDRYKKQ